MRYHNKARSAPLKSRCWRTSYNKKKTKTTWEALTFIFFCLQCKKSRRERDHCRELHILDAHYAAWENTFFWRSSLFSDMIGRWEVDECIHRTGAISLWFWVFSSTVYPSTHTIQLVFLHSSSFFGSWLVEWSSAREGEKGETSLALFKELNG